MSVPHQTGFITLESSNETPLITIDFSKIDGHIKDEKVYKQTVVNTITAAIYISESNTYNVVINASDIDNRYMFFSKDFVSDLTKSFLCKEYVKTLNLMQIYNAPDWLKKNMDRMCFALYSTMKDKVQYVEQSI